jgi:lipase chaperone LimK
MSLPIFAIPLGYLMIGTKILIFTLTAVAGITMSSIYLNTEKASHSGEPSTKIVSPSTAITETTESILGYKSKHGALPKSLRGPTIGNALQVDEDGNLIISIDLKDLFDYFLSTITEEDLDTILLRINEYLTHYLQDPALSEAKAILTQYIEFKYSLMDLEKEMGEELAQMSQQDKVNGGYLRFLQKQMHQRNTLRSQHLDIEVHEIFYEDEELYDEYTYSKLLVTSDASLSAIEQFDRVAELQSALPEDVRESIRNTQITDELRIRTNQLLESGGDQEQVRELRREMFGDSAVQRFDELDQQRAAWNSRINSYLTQRATILSSQGLTEDELNLQVDDLRSSLFNKLEQIRIRGLE